MRSRVQTVAVSSDRRAFWSRAKDRASAISQPGRLAKRALDVGIVTLAIALLVPLIVTLIGALLLSQGRPVIYRQQRIGRNGVPFACFKFRTMVLDGETVLKAHLATNPDARREWDTARKLKDDPRATPLGRLMRRASADELPQLFNILRNEMSLVGPRPIVADEIPHYGPNFTSYTRMKPGLTGLWQVSGRSDISYAERVRLDADYAARQSFWGDMAILLRTVPVVLRARGSY